MRLTVICENRRCTQPASMHVFDPQIDTILTTFTYMQRSMANIGMTKVCLYVDMQLYVVKQVGVLKPA